MKVGVGLSPAEKQTGQGATKDRLHYTRPLCRTQ